MAAESVERAKAQPPLDADAALADRLQRLEDAIEVNSKLARVIALDAAEIWRALTEPKSVFFDTLYRKVVWAVANGVILSGILVAVVAFGLTLLGALLAVD